MATASCSDEEFVRLFEIKGPTKLAMHLGVTVRNVLARRSRLEGRLKRKIESPYLQGGVIKTPIDRERRLELKITDGHIIVGGDAHYWPGRETCAHRGFVYLADKLKVKAAVMNGDAFDGAKVSKHPPIGWSKPPGVKEELEAVDERMSEIRSAAPDDAKLIWLYGNHDMRFENRLAERAAEFEGVKGFRLQDHFPHWKFAWSLWINNNVVVKHRLKGGIHASHNNTMYAGKTIVTNHLHNPKVSPFTDYNGTRYGVDTGTMADPEDEQFDYTEENPLNWRMAFAVLSFKNGKLLYPELVHVFDKNHIDFRGELIRV